MPCDSVVRGKGLARIRLLFDTTTAELQHAVTAVWWEEASRQHLSGGGRRSLLLLHAHCPQKESLAALLFACSDLLCRGLKADLTPGALVGYVNFERRLPGEKGETVPSEEAQFWHM